MYVRRYSILSLSSIDSIISMSSFLDFVFSSFICTPPVRYVLNARRNSLFEYYYIFLCISIGFSNIRSYFRNNLRIYPFTINTHNWLKTNAVFGICPTSGTLIYMESPKGQKYGFLDLWQVVQEYLHWGKLHGSLSFGLRILKSQSCSILDELLSFYLA